jgi:hypothetical protein
LDGGSARHKAANYTHFVHINYNEHKDEFVELQMLTAMNAESGGVCHQINIPHEVLMKTSVEILVHALLVVLLLVHKG